MNTGYLSEKVFLVEKKAIPPDRWDEVPEYVKREVRGVIDDPNNRIPIAFAYDEELGWCILSTGQGPFFVWVEHQNVAEEVL